MKKFKVVFSSFPDFSGNARALYNFITENYKNKIDCYWAVNNQKMLDYLENLGINTVLLGSDKFNKLMEQVDYIFTTHANFIGDKYKSNKSIYVELWHGIGPKSSGYMVKNISEDDRRWYDEISKAIDYMIVPSEFWRVIFASVFKVSADRILPIGLPVLNTICNSKGKDNLKKILKEYNYNIFDYKKLLLYMPTFKKGCGRTEISSIESNILNLENYNEQELISYLEKNNYLLCVKIHPSEESSIKIINNKNIIYLKNDYLNDIQIEINDLLNAFDLLITDYSSIGPEFSFLKRPVINICNDLNEYLNNRGILFNNFKYWATSNICQNLNELTNEIDNSLNNKLINNDLLSLWYNNVEDDGGCKKICEYFFENREKNNIKRVNNLEYYLKEENNKLKNINLEQENTIKKLTESKIELDLIKNSKSWKLLEKFRKAKLWRKK